MQVNGPEGKKLARKKPLTVSIGCMAIYRPTPGFKGRAFKFCVLNSWDFKFCVRSSPLREGDRQNEKEEKVSEFQEWQYYTGREGTHREIRPPRRQNDQNQ